MDNKEVNEKLKKLENKKIELIKKKQLVETNITDLVIKSRKLGLEKTETDVEITKLNIEITQLRREFKLEGYSSKRLRNLIPDQKRIIIETRNNVCEDCKSKKNLSVHHNKPLSHGGTNALFNLKVLCEDCHKKLHRI